MKKILILGAKGMLGRQLLAEFGAGAIGWDREESDVTRFSDLRLKIRDSGPDAIINCVAFNDVDGAEERGEIADLLNAEVAAELAKITNELGIPLVHFSTNYVFDGKQGEYLESDRPAPLSVYGRSKYRGEQLIRQNADKFYLVRTAVLFGEKGVSELSKKSFVEIMLELSEKTATIKAVNDEVNSLTYVADLAANVKRLLDEQVPFGIYHITNSGSASWYDFAKEIFSITGKKINLIPVPSTDFPRKAVRPNKAVLLNTKLPAIRPWQEALREFLISK